MGAVLDVIRRPVSRARFIIAFVEECIERFEDERLVSFFHHHLSSPRSRGSTDLIDTVTVEGDVILDLRHLLEWTLIIPHRTLQTLPPARYTLHVTAHLVQPRH